jgi:hypothetical protein
MTRGPFANERWRPLGARHTRWALSSWRPSRTRHRRCRSRSNTAPAELISIGSATYPPQPPWLAHSDHTQLDASADDVRHSDRASTVAARRSLLTRLAVVIICAYLARQRHVVLMRASRGRAVRMARWPASHRSHNANNVKINT